MSKTTIFKIPERFRKYGQVFTKVLEGHSGYLYARSDENGIIAYEVFKKRSQAVIEGSSFHKKFQGYDRYELYPGNECFGDWAWCCMSLEKAEEYFELINTPENETDKN